MKRKRTPPSRRRGSALLLAILVLLIVTIAGLALMFNTSLENTISGNETKVSKAFYAAESGIQYAAQKLATDVNYVGGPVPGGMSSNIPGQIKQDLSITITQPTVVGYIIHPGDELQSQGSTYGSSQTVETVYAIRSTAASQEISAQKVITAQVGVYPQQLSIH